MKINVSLSIGFVGAVHEDELELPDDATEDDIDEAAKEWAWNYIDIGWHREGEE